MTVVLLTGADGFIGRNLAVRLRERADVELLCSGRQTGRAELERYARRADAVFHLAGVNRPTDPAEFDSGNAGQTEGLIEALQASANKAPILYASSIQAELDNLYGASKRKAEEALMRHAQATGADVQIFRLPNVFGKWARPNYNSVVATFCHNVARGQPISVRDEAAPMRLIHVDAVADAFLASLDAQPSRLRFPEVGPVHETTVGEIARLIEGFPEIRRTLEIPNVGSGLMRELYATYLSYLPTSEFDYAVPVHADPRGEFVEMLKSRCTGQFSYFTASPGVTRGDHYHHTKTEKFLVMAGTAHFGFRHVLTDETHEIVCAGGEGRIVETVPGWTHNITNIGNDQLVVMLWANEIFERDRPDTISMKV